MFVEGIWSKYRVFPYIQYNYVLHHVYFIKLKELFKTLGIPFNTQVYIVLGEHVLAARTKLDWFWLIAVSGTDTVSYGMYFPSKGLFSSFVDYVLLITNLSFTSTIEVDWINVWLWSLCNTDES